MPACHSLPVAPPAKSIWVRVGEALTALARGEPLSRLWAHLRGAPEQSVAFTIAVIALGAKLAKADGRVTRDEVRAFREVFHIPPAGERHAARVFDLARQDASGFETYARQIRRLFAGRPAAPFCEIMEGLFHIARADGAVTASEETFLARVAEILGLAPEDYARLRARFVPASDGGCDPWAVLGVAPDAPMAQIRKARAALVRECHPDRLRGRGLPDEVIRMAEKRIQDVNRAWDAIRRQRGDVAGRPRAGDG